MTRTRARGALAAFAFVASACAPPTVVRSAGGELLPGRFIAPQAYEAYARGALAEAEGRLRFAAAAYHRAAQIDPDGPEAWTRLGAVLCRQKEPARADEAFLEAERADDSYAPLYRERARCDLAHGRLKEALEASERSLILDPVDEDSALLRAEILERSGDTPQAIRELFARLVAGPKRAAVATLLAKLAEDTHDVAAAHFARTILGPPPLQKSLSEQQRREAARQELDAALARGDGHAAINLGVEAGITPGGVALRAAALGQSAIALEQARLVLGASPADVDAAVVLMATGGASPPFVIPPRTAPPSRLARLVLAEALLRRVGPEAAAAAAGSELEAKDADPLETAVAARLRKAKNASR